ncbi:hypothetical protein GGI12_001182 [Dipsacomyces acuminosporus]|nr:hypothetical protein GGI12_001182 [Dipsacomyces acuminosporus]
MSFSIFEQTKQWLRKHDPYRTQPSPLGLPNFQRETIGSVALAASISGSIAGAMIAVCCCPLELVKVQMQLANLLSKDVAAAVAATNTNANTNAAAVAAAAAATTAGANCSMESTSRTSSAGGHKRKSAVPTWARSNLSVCKEIVLRKGVFGLYSGLQLHVVRDSSGTAIYFAAYETVKETMRRLNGSETTGPLTHMLAGGICGVVSWLLIFPVDLTKSTMQSQVLKPKDAQLFANSWQCVCNIYKRMGFSGLYRGVSVSLIRAFPLHGLNFVVYEWARSTICGLAGQPAK